nr:MAG TPA: hypothetical protein [Caudoviricetes sp.]DAL79784.1 MAG TPA: hypothetical protein [Caudoviricetes sp.]
MFIITRTFDFSILYLHKTCKNVLTLQEILIL